MSDAIAFAALMALAVSGVAGVAWAAYRIGRDVALWRLNEALAAKGAGRPATLVFRTHTITGTVGRRP